ncbi:MAG: DegT/DnrJ/EryC1/StrS family aminotransferase, partial [candidate division WOR-3 bacterium]
YPLPLHLQECFRYLGYKKGDFPYSEKAAEEVLSLPVFPELKQKEIKYVAESIKSFLGN